MTYIHETAILDPGAEIGENTKIWHFTHIMSKAKIGESVSVGQNCFIGDNVVVGIKTINNQNPKIYFEDNEQTVAFNKKVLQLSHYHILYT